MNRPTKAPPRVVIVTGPTASGKSSVAVSLAQRLHAEIVNCDSVQMYREAIIGSARISATEEGGVPHHLFNLLSPAEVFDAASFAAKALDCISEIQSRGKRGFVVGGPSLYLTTLLHGIVDLPKADPSLRKELEALGSEVLYKRLEGLDPARAQELHPNDRVRIMRALETAQLTGDKPSLRRLEHRYGAESLCALILVLCWDREELHARIQQRTLQMLSAGIVQEVQGLIERYGLSSQVLRAIGYSQTASALRGEIAMNDLAARITEATRQLAKRQMTYLRNEPPKRGWALEPDQAGSTGSIKSFRTLDLQYEGLCERVRAWFDTEPERNTVLYLDAKRMLLA